jgi:hypothetical protein
MKEMGIFKMKDYKNSKVKEDVYPQVLGGLCFAIVVVLSAFLYLLLGA